MSERVKPRVLLVEDIDFNRDLVAQILEDDYQVIEAVDGVEGVRLALEQHPDLILMDLSLPGIDGWEATRRIKGEARLRQVPVIALTAHAMAGDRERALAAGCDDFLTKPLDDALLLRRVAEWLQRAGGGNVIPFPAPGPTPTPIPIPAPTPAPAPTGASGGDVLIVDDSPDNRDQLTEELEGEGFHVRACPGGVEALAAVAARPPDVIVLDVKMPGLDGVEVCRRLRAEPATADVMIVFCSAAAGAQNISRALDAGGNDYVTRPYEAVELVARVRAAVRMKRSQEVLRRHIRDVAASVAASQSGRPLASILLAIDDRDAVRAEQPPATWDALVHELAGLVRQHTRQEDVVARYGDAELLILLPNQGALPAQRLAETLRDAVHDRTFLSDTAALHITVSSGVACFDARATEAAARVVRMADAALFLALRAGTSQVKVYHG